MPDDEEPKEDGPAKDIPGQQKMPFVDEDDDDSDDEDEDSDEDDE